MPLPPAEPRKSVRVEADDTVILHVADNEAKIFALDFEIGVFSGHIDDIDRLLAQHYGFSAIELDFILNYDIKHRSGRDSELAFSGHKRSDLHPEYAGAHVSGG